MQEELAQELAQGHFEHRRSVADHAVLLDACQSVGLPSDQASKVYVQIHSSGSNLVSGARE